MTKELKISAIKEGTVIDHVPSDAAFKVAEILNLDKIGNIVSVATNLKSKRSGKKGIIKVGDRTLTKEEVDKISIIAPKATVNIIKDYEVKEKIQVSIPRMFFRIIRCSNPNCITNNESVKTRFKVIEEDPLKVKCDYCERCMGKEDIELR